MLQEAKNTEYTVTAETFDTLTSLWLDAGNNLHWGCLFVLPVWLKAWWNNFNAGFETYLCAVREGGQPVGIAPLMVRGKAARLIGSADVCDYLDCIVVPEKEQEFFSTIIRHLQKQGIVHLELSPVRPDSIVFSHLPSVAKSLGCGVLCTPDDVVLELKLPATWDAFLDLLSGKERHELRRKLRRLEEAGDIAYRIVENPEQVVTEIDTFIALFRQNRADKASFMTEQMVSFFRSISACLAEAHILKLFFLYLDEHPAAAVLCFDYHGTMYLYNNGYNNRYRSLSVGLISKVLSIKESILRRSKKYDFLKGAEVYKQRLGGTPVSLYRCHITL